MKHLIVQSLVFVERNVDVRVFAFRNLNPLARLDIIELLRRVDSPYHVIDIMIDNHCSNTLIPFPLFVRDITVGRCYNIKSSVNKTGDKHELLNISCLDVINLERTKIVEDE